MAKGKLRARLAHLRRRHGHRVRRAGIFSANVLKTEGLAAVVGGASHFAGYFAGDKVTFIGGNWYGEPLLLLVLALLLRRRQGIACALAGAAGYAGAANYRWNQYQGGKSTTPPVHQFSASASRALPSSSTAETGAAQWPVAQFAT